MTDTSHLLKVHVLSTCRLPVSANRSKAVYEHFSRKNNTAEYPSILPKTFFDEELLPRELSLKQLHTVHILLLHIFKSVVTYQLLMQDIQLHITKPLPWTL